MKFYVVSEDYYMWLIKIHSHSVPLDVLYLHWFVENQ